jgi:putative DNA primase/helicase
MHQAGFQPGHIEPNTNGFVRFDAPGDKKGKQNGFYKLKLGEWPVGWFGDWKNGESHQWFYADPDASPLSDTERRSIKKEQARLKAEAQQARETRAAEVAEDASKKWKQSTSDVAGHPYLERKQISTPKGLRVYSAHDGTQLLAVPMMTFDQNGAAQLTNLQMISPDGEKRFLKGGKVEGAFFFIKGDATLTVICEGVATAFSIWEATGLSTVAAFNAGNLIPVAKEYARYRPLAPLLIAGDDDAMAPEDWATKGNGRPWENTGRLKAEATAKAVGARWILPVFEAGQARSRTDFNDLFVQEGKQAVAGQVIGCMRSMEPEDMAPGAQVVEIDHVQNEEWRTLVPTTATGALDGNNIEGVAVYITHHNLLKQRLAFNAFTKEMELDGAALEGYHVSAFRRVMHHDKFKARKPDVQDEMEAEARRCIYDPLSDYLNGLKWDRKPRIDTWLSEYLGVEDNAYTRSVGRKFLIGAVARALEPGCKNDTMLVLEGPQGIGKSTAARYLFGDRFFTDNLPDFHSKDSFQQLQGAWCIEVAELSALSKAEVKDVKQFLSRLVDKFRAPYERHPLSIPRRTVFIGTVNPEDGGYLRDPTGNRRFWPVECTTADLPGILADRDKLWAEAVAAYRQREEWYLVDDQVGAAQVEQDKRREVHPWEAVIGDYANAESLQEMTVSEALTKAIKVPPDRQTVAMSRQVGSAFRALGWDVVVKRPFGGSKPTKVFVRPGAGMSSGLDWGDDAS